MLDYGANQKMTKIPGGKSQHVNYVVMELASNGELFDIIAPIGGFSERITWFYFWSFLESLAYLHNNGICHRDLKPENLLLTSDWKLKIADFGFSAKKSVSGTKMVGTPGYTPPDVENKVDYSGKSLDLFATAVILFIMLSGNPPFRQARSDDQHYKNIIVNRLDAFWKTHISSKGT